MIFSVYGKSCMHVFSNLRHHFFSQMLAESLEEFKLLKNESDLPTIATLPPDFQPIPCKPTFFDISLNHIGTYFSLFNGIPHYTGAIIPVMSIFLFGILDSKKIETI